MLNSGSSRPRGIVAHEKFPLATIHKAVLEFLRGRDDGVIFGGHAVNFYVKEPRLTQEIDLLSMRTAKLATELRDYLNRRFRIFLLIRKLNKGHGRRIYQATKVGSQTLVDVRPAAKLPIAKRISGLLVMEPAELIASKVIAYHHRRDKPKSAIDRRDLTMLLATFPELKNESSSVVERLQDANVDQAVIEVWKELVAQEKRAANDRI